MTVKAGKAPFQDLKAFAQLSIRNDKRHQQTDDIEEAIRTVTKEGNHP